MRSIWLCVFVLAVDVRAEQHKFNDPSIPIHLVETNKGQGGILRVTYLEAVIKPQHLKSRARVNFPRSGEVEKHFKAVRAQGDERGHLVGSQFSGPPTIFNLSPQSPRVNRNLNFQAITTDWFKTECEVAKFLAKGGNRFVMWSVTLSYMGTLNRPTEYRLQVQMVSNGKTIDRIDTRLQNPLLNKKSTFWICSKCKDGRRGPRQAEDGCKVTAPL